MARIKVVSRTINSTNVHYLGVHVAEGTTFEGDIKIPDQPANDAKLLNAVKKAVEDENTIVVKVLEAKAESKLLALTEAEFFATARELDPVTHKFVGTDITADTDDTQPAEAPADTDDVQPAEAPKTKKNK